MPGKFPNQPLISPNCFSVLSEQMWELGFRHHPELQTKWIKPISGATRNFTTWDVTDIMPTAVEMLVEQFPEKAKTLAGVTQENHKQMVKEQEALVLNSLEKLQAAIDSMQGE
jgi:hypothetical protein